MELKVSLLCLQEPIGGPYPELHEWLTPCYPISPATAASDGPHVPLHGHDWKYWSLLEL
jgi:hypothetical protein